MLINNFLSMFSLLIKQPVSPNLAKALNNPALREASYSLPDGTIVIDPKKEKSPTLTAALQNPYLKSASYTLPDGTIIIDPRKPVPPNLSKALKNSALRDTSFALPEGIHDPNTPISPNLLKVSYGFRLCFFFILTFTSPVCVCVCSITSSSLPIRNCVEGHTFCVWIQNAFYKLIEILLC